MVKVTVPVLSSWSESAAPPIATFCAVSQLAVVKSTEVGVAVRKALVAMVTVTLLVGAVLSRNDSGRVDPSSVTEAGTAVNIMPGVSPPVPKLSLDPSRRPPNPRTPMSSRLPIATPNTPPPA